MAKQPISGATKARVAAILAGARATNADHSTAGAAAEIRNLGHLTKAQNQRANQAGGGGGGGGFDIGGAFGKALSVIDLGRSAVVAADKQLNRGAVQVASALGIDDIPQKPKSLKQQALNYAASVAQDANSDPNKPDISPEQETKIAAQWLTTKGTGSAAEQMTPQKWQALYGAPSASEWLGDTKRHIGFAEDASLAAGNVDQAGHPTSLTGNAAGDFALGFGGDVLFDPLTWIGAGGGAAEVIHALEAPEAAARATEAGLRIEDIVAKVSRGGVGALTPEEAAVAGERAGFTVAGREIPGSQGLRRTLNSVNPIVKGKAAMLDAADALTYNPAKGGDLKDALGFLANVRGKTAPLKVLARSGDAEQAMAGVYGLRALRTGVNEGIGLSKELIQGFNKTIADHALTDQEAANAVWALQGDEFAKTLVDPKKLDAVRSWFDNAAATYETITGRTMPRLEDYVPHQMTSEALSSLGEDVRKVGGIDQLTPDFMKHRGLVPGASFLGEAIPEGTPADVMRWLNEKAQAEFGHDLFKTDLKEIVQAYATGVGRGVGSERMSQILARAGRLTPHPVAVDEAAVAKNAERVAARTSERNAAREAAVGGSTKRATGEADALAAQAQATKYRTDLANALNAPVPPVENFTPEDWARLEAEQSAGGVAPSEVAGPTLQARQPVIPPPPERPFSPTGRYTPDGDPIADTYLWSQHEKLANSPAREFASNGSTKADAVNYLFDVRDVAERSGNHTALVNAELAIEEVAKGGAHVGLSQAYAEAALSAIHDTATGMTIADRAEQIAGQSLGAAIPEAESAPRAAQALAPLTQHGLDLTAADGQRFFDAMDVRGAAQQLTSDLQGGNWPYLSAEARDQFLTDFGEAEREGVIGTAQHAQKVAIDRFNEAVAIIDRHQPGWRDAGMDPMFGAGGAGAAPSVGERVRGALARPVAPGEVGAGDVTGKPAREWFGPDTSIRDARRIAKGEGVAVSEGRRMLSRDELLAKLNELGAPPEAPLAKATGATTAAQEAEKTLEQRLNEITRQREAITVAVGPIAPEDSHVTAAAISKQAAEQSQRVALKATKGTEAEAQLWIHAGMEYDQAAQWATAAAATSDPIEAQVYTLRAQEHMMWGKFHETDVKVGTAEAKLAKAQVPKLAKLTNDTATKMLAGEKMILDPHVARALDAVAQLTSPVGQGRFLQDYDKVLNYIKTWQLTTPRFLGHIILGHAWNNALAGIKVSAYGDFFKADRAFSEGGTTWERFAAKNATLADRYTQLRTTVGGMSHDFAEVELGTSARTKNPFSARGPVVSGIRKGASNIQRMMRVSLGLDTMEKGGDLAAAMEKIAQFHFDYGDVTGFEQGVVKRVIPFYTWTRRNLPLQLQMLAMHPATFSHYGSFVKNVQAVAGPDEQIIPQYFGDAGAFKTPINVGGSRLYGTSDALPIKELTTNWLSPETYGSAVTPLIKTPLEILQQKQFYKGIPLTDKKVPANELLKRFAPVLKPLGVMDGKGNINQNAQYAIEQLIPAIATASRQVGGTPKDQQRLWANWLNMSGISVRVNTPYEQKNEKIRRAIAKLDRTTKPVTIRVPK